MHDDVNNINNIIIVIVIIIVTGALLYDNNNYNKATKMPRCTFRGDGFSSVLSAFV